MSSYKKILLLLAILSLRSFGQNCAFSVLSYTYAGGITLLDIKDFNNDGKMDMHGVGTSSVNCHLQTTPNSFSTITSSITNTGYLYVGCGDLNNDGNVDFLNENSYFLGQGNGSFTSSVSTTPISRVAPSAGSLFLWTPILKDFNSDGKTDVLNTSNLFTGIGNGNFNPASSIASIASLPGLLTAFESGLINGDANFDIITASCMNPYPSTQSTITVLLGAGNGSFASTASFTVSNHVTQIKIADVNNDGKTDLILDCSYGPNSVKVLLGSGTGSFTLLNTYNISSQIMDVGDMNNDGSKDIVVCYAIQTANGLNVTPTVNILFNDGAANFSSSPNFTFTTMGNQTGNIMLKDLNNDNLTDIAINTWSSSIGHQNTILFSNPNCVWPGDANANGVANNSDILEIGLQFNQTGAARTPTSNSWNGYSYTAWTGSVSTGKNKANADCNGDGSVNLNDTLAVYNNFGFMHNKNSNVAAANEDITIVPDQASVLKNTWGTASIFLGSSTNNINNIHGVAFNVNYDNSLIETDSVWIEYISSFINSNNLHFRKRVFANGVLYAATTHTNQIDASGNGKIAILHYKITPTLSSNTVLSLSVSNANKLSAAAVSSTLSSGSGTLNAVISASSIKENSLDAHIIVFPNPSSGQITIKQFDKNKTADKIEIYNSVGQLVFYKKINSMLQTIDTDLSKGIYFYSLSNSAGQTYKDKLIIE